MSEKRKPGRPRLPDADRRSHYVGVRLSPPELERLKALATDAGMDLSGWAREVLLRSVAGGGA